MGAGFISNSTAPQASMLSLASSLPGRVSQYDPDHDEFHCPAWPADGLDFLLRRRWGHCPFRIGWYGDAAIRIDCSRLATPSAALPTGGIRGIDDPTRLRYRRKRVAAEWIPS